MSIKRAKSVDTLYEDCKGADLVLVPGAPLASALNRRLDQPHFGSFAITPRRLAAGHREQAEDRRAFLEVIEHTDLGWKEASYVVGNILQCWEHQGSVDAILDYDAFATPATRTAVDCIADVSTTSRQLSQYTIDADTEVAVVGGEQFTTLERSILSADYTSIDPFHDDGFTKPPFRILESPAAIVETVLDTVTPANAEDVGVVLDAGSRYSALLESELDAAEIPYYGGPGFVDQPHHRAFVQLLRIAHAGRETLVGDVRPLLTKLGMSVDAEHDEKRLDALEGGGAEWLQQFSADVHDSTFEAATETYESVTSTTIDAMGEELSTLGTLDEPVTEAAVDRLTFYLDTYEIPVDRENDGVLLADATTAGHVDRPVVFYLGLDEGWAPTSPRRPWIDRTSEVERNLAQFQRLLQSGVEQYYLVQDSAGGRPVTPCLYFEELLDDEFEQFSDLDAIRHGRPSRAAQDGFEREPVDVSTEPVDLLSQSSLNTYVNSPRDYFFDELLTTRATDYLTEGNLFHDFAEFYVSHPDRVTADDLDELADVLLEEVEPFLRDVDRRVRRTKHRIGLETIVDFLDANPPQGDAFVTPDGGRRRNVFADHFGLSVRAPHAERWFENTDVGVKGKIDLVHGPAHLVDHKSGTKKSAYQVVTHSAIDPPSDTPNYQALLYLAHQRTKQPGEELRFTFFHFLETLDDVVVGEGVLDDCLTTVTYYPTAYEEYIARESTFEELQEEAANDCQKTFQQVEYESYRAVLDEYPVPMTRDSDELIASEFGQALTERMQTEVGEYKYVKKGCKQALRHLLRIRNQNYFTGDVDRFEQFIEDRLAELNTRAAGEERFPVDGLGGEPNYRRVDHRDCLLEGGTR